MNTDDHHPSGSLPDPREISRSVARVSLGPLGGAARLGRQLIRWPLDALTGAPSNQTQPPLPESTGSGHQRSKTPKTDDRRAELSAEMRRLLDRSVSQSRLSSQYELYAGLLRQLLPDEARILAALSDGGSAPVVHVISRTRRPNGGRRVLKNASSVGRSAGVALPELVPTYVTHLLQLGLVELDVADDANETDFELLMAETVVRRALEQAGEDSVLPPRTVRQTLRMSALGQSLWAACRPVTEPGT